MEMSGTAHCHANPDRSKWCDHAGPGGFMGHTCRAPVPGPITHELKIDVGAFDAVRRGVKTAEVRWNDRDFKVGDELLLCEGRQVAAYRDDRARFIYTSNEIRRSITHVQTGYGLPEGLCVLSLGEPAKVSPPIGKRNAS